jgi:hypothetical protein
MASLLVSLPIELFQRVVEFLSITDARDLLSTCSNLYRNGKNVLEKKCFSVLPVNLSKESLEQAEDILTEEPCHRFLQAVRIRLDKYVFHGPYSQEHEEAIERLASVLTRALQVSTKFDTIIIYDSPSRFHDTDGTGIRTVAMAIEMVDNIRPFKVRIQNIRTYNSKELWVFGDVLFDNLQSIELRIDGEKQKLRELSYIKEVLSIVPNLEELSIIANRGTITSKAVRRITESICSKKLKSLTIAGISASKADLQDSIQPFQDSLKELILKYADFDDFRLFIKLIVYIKNNFSLDYIYFKEISERELFLLNQERSRGGDIVQKLKSLKANILSNPRINRIESEK